MVARLRRAFWTILISLTTIAFVYLTIVNTAIEQEINKPKNLHRNVKHIVAYSLLKKIEIESEHYTCEERLDDDEVNYSAINGSDEDYAWTNIDGSAVHVLSVHLDRRLEPYHYVRIIGMIKGIYQETVYCQISSPTETVVTKVTTTPIWLDAWDQNDTNVYFNPVLLSCRIPLGLAPENVSITTKPCDGKQGKHFSLTNDTGNSQYTFTVCVKPLDFLEDISERLIQWIEMIRILGAEKIEIYVKKVKRNVWKILKWYDSNYPDQITIRKFHVVKDADTNKNYNFSWILWQKRRYEVATYNSCFYRNIGLTRFIIPLDIDEIILPRHLFTWKNVLQDIYTTIPGLKENFASFMVPNTYFFGELPKNETDKIFFLRNILRSRFSPPGESGKSFISTKNTLTVFNHYALDVLKPGISRTFFVPSNVAQLNHYKETCNAVILPECVKYVSSPRIKDKLVFRYEKVFMYKYSKRILLFKKLGFFM
ncbi:uncharacterized protein LOC108903440 [Anoplophora glabripennis]|uniref:uncharacterized protein LOC108903440 n=1 Tax=Anoplophora glabripennis TaxID=217634 RepID=UPI0008737966|nr:uncharacterized protein LOC108903440 [Anoplophora glabripennis]